MRRLVKHAAAGVGAAAFAVVAGVTTLGSSGSDVVVAVPAATSLAPPPGSAPETTGPDPAGATAPDGTSPDPTGAASSSPVPVGAGAQSADRTTRVDREAREAEQVRVTLALIKVADQRAGDLGTQREAIAQQQLTIKAEAVAARRAKAAAAKAARAGRPTTPEPAAKPADQPGYDSGDDPRTIAKKILKDKYDYGDEQFACFSFIIERESNWDIDATNPSSGAYGIPQALPGSKMASVAADWKTNPVTQIIWAVGYMDDRYGSPCQAKTFKAAHGWY